MPAHFSWTGDDAPDAIIQTDSGFVAWHRRCPDGRQAAGHGDPRNGQTYEVVSLWGGRSAARTAANRRGVEGVPMAGRWAGAVDRFDGARDLAARVAVAWEDRPSSETSLTLACLRTTVTVPLGLLAGALRVFGAAATFAGKQKPY